MRKMFESFLKTLCRTQSCSM